ncbi:hypothetical protein HMPREF3037_03305 [Candidatus Stoquefichus sp. KLE1796]|nr:hypothetical protein HMPREF3037_03305 [Candidatus Stoquefichus sp. KLE1796]
MENKVKVTIKRDKEIQLIFHFDEELSLNLSTDDTVETQNFFLALFKKIINMDGTISLLLSDEVEDLYYDVSKKYISNLEEEIKKVMKEIPQRKKINI